MNKIVFPIIFLILLVFLGGAILISSRKENSISLEDHANKILAKCSSQSQPGSRRTCYESEVPKLVGTVSLEDAFKLVELIQEKDDTYLWCHNMAHQISEREYARDPSRWNEVMTRCPVGTCSKKRKLASNRFGTGKLLP